MPASGGWRRPCFLGLRAAGAIHAMPQTHRVGASLKRKKTYPPPWGEGGPLPALLSRSGPGEGSVHAALTAAGANQGPTPKYFA